MADSAAVAPPAQDTPNLQLDEVTGEMVSKSELKKRQKKRETEKRKVLSCSILQRPVGNAALTHFSLCRLRRLLLCQ
jgi:hypothetical protein